MIDIIQRHNRLNGILFSIAEFAFICLLVGAFAIYYLLHNKPIHAAVAWGITLNCLPVILIGTRMLFDPSEASPSFWNKDARQNHLRDNPTMLRDTLILTTATLIPFVALASVLVDVVIRRSRIR